MGDNVDVAIEEETIIYEEENAYEEETVYDEEIVCDEEVFQEIPVSERVLLPLDEGGESVLPSEHDVADGEASDQSSIWVDDGKIVILESSIGVVTAGNSHDDFASDSDGDLNNSDAFILDIPEIDEVSSLEDLSVDEESDASSYVIEEILGDSGEIGDNQKKATGRETFNQSADWDIDDDLWSVGEKGVEETEMEVDQPASTPEKEDEAQRITELPTLSTHSRSSLKRKRQQHLFCGREAELERLRRALEGADKPGIENPRRIAWIHGIAGIGKTALAEEIIRRDMTSSNYLVVRGCFDERSHASKPFSAVVDCCMDIVDQLINDTLSNIDWGERLQAGLGEESRLLSTLIPNLALLLGVDETAKHDSSFDMASSRLFDRLRFVIRRFIRVVCLERRVVIFLDDLQWADEDSLRLVDTLLSTHALHNFFFIACHQGIKHTHLLAIVKAKVTRLCAVDMMLAPLEKGVAHDVVIGSLNRKGGNASVEGIDELSSWLNDKAKYNPLHITELLYYCMDREFIYQAEGDWEWGSDVFLQADQAPSTAVDLAAARIKMLAEEDRLVIKSAAFLGTKVFHLDTLYQAIFICASSEKKAGVSPIQDISKVEKSLDRAREANIIEKTSYGKYAFAHDSTRKAAVSLLPKGKTKQSLMHSKLASELLKLQGSCTTDADNNEALTLLVVDHLSLATEHLETARNKELLGKFYIELADMAKKKASFSTSVRRAQSGLALLDQRKRWKESYEQTLKLHLAMSRGRFCQRNFDQAKVFADAILAKGKNERDKIGAYELLIWLAVASNKLEDAFHLILFALEKVWEENPVEEVEKEVAKVRALGNKIPDADLMLLQPMTHRKTSSKLVFLSMMAEISWLRQDYLHQDLAALRMTELTIRYGASAYSSLAFSMYGICLARRNLHREAYRFGHLAEMTAKTDSLHGAQAVAFHHYAIAYWRKPFQASLEPLRRSATMGMESNDMENLSFRVGAFLSHFIATGERLQSSDPLFRKFKEYAIAFRARESWLTTVPFRFILQMRGESPEPAERGFVRYTDARAIQYEIFFNMIHAVFTHDIQNADRLSSKLFLKPEGVWLPYRGFMEGLIATSLARTTSGKVRVKHQKKAAKIIEVLGGWARKGLKQVFHMAHLVNIELRMAIAMDMNPTESSALYDSAINAAAKAGFKHHEALANERAGMMYSLEGEERLAAKYVARACELYESWGAFSRVRFLKRTFPQYLNGSSIHQSKKVPAASSDPFAPSVSEAGPSLDFGASQIFHFPPPVNLRADGSGTDHVSPRVDNQPNIAKGRAGLQRPMARGSTGGRSGRGGRGRGRPTGQGRLGQVGGQSQQNEKVPPATAGGNGKEDAPNKAVSITSSEYVLPTRSSGEGENTKKTRPGGLLLRTLSLGSMASFGDRSMSKPKKKKGQSLKVSGKTPDDFNEERRPDGGAPGLDDSSAREEEDGDKKARKKRSSSKGSRGSTDDDKTRDESDGEEVRRHRNMHSGLDAHAESSSERKSLQRRLVKRKETKKEASKSNVTSEEPLNESSCKNPLKVHKHPSHSRSLSGKSLAIAMIKAQAKKKIKYQPKGEPPSTVNGSVDRASNKDEPQKKGVSKAAKKAPGEKTKKIKFVPKKAWGIATDEKTASPKPEPAVLVASDLGEAKAPDLTLASVENGTNEDLSDRAMKEKSSKKSKKRMTLSSPKPMLTSLIRSLSWTKKQKKKGKEVGADEVEAAQDDSKYRSNKDRPAVSRSRSWSGKHSDVKGSSTKLAKKDDVLAQDSNDQSKRMKKGSLLKKLLKKSKKKEET